MCCKAESCGISLSAVILKSVCCRKSTFYSQTIALLPVFEDFAKANPYLSIFIIPHSSDICIDFIRNIWYNVRYGGEDMIRIAVCDDFKDTVNQVNGYLSEYQQLKERKLDIKSFFNAEDLWEYLRKNRCDLIILDIELVKMNGVELGHLIRTELKDNIIKIVYISAKNCYDRQLFDVQPLNFLQKPIDKEKLFKMVDLTVELLSSSERVFVFESKQGTFRIKFNDILYFESFDHYFKIATKSGDYEFKSTMSEIKEQISEARFVQVHRSYIINYDNTSHIKYEEVTMLNGDVISVSRDRRKEVREIVSEWERGKI